MKTTCMPASCSGKQNMLLAKHALIEDCNCKMQLICHGLFNDLAITMLIGS